MKLSRKVACALTVVLCTSYTTKIVYATSNENTMIKHENNKLE
ncbi:MAG: hypothetical protein NSGCLCUN01_02308 [uncultured Clostridium sp.]